jgi:2-polyprenyl-3-methyl-5-hydroxy-6-metoxy-1,4-benzoquinol methylase
MMMRISPGSTRIERDPHYATAKVLHRASDTARHQAGGAEDLPSPRGRPELPALRRDPLTPPKGRELFGSGDFNQVGEEYFRYFVQLGGLEPHERVLDVGCGIGRMACRLPDISTIGALARGSTCSLRA